VRYDKGHKEETRQRIIDAAAKRFREDGVASAGVAGLMADAGLTNGAFYAHFDSKEDLLRAALVQAHDKRKEAMQAARARGDDPEVWIRAYLSPRHRDNPGTGCLVSTLAAEIARHPHKTREVFALGVAEFIDLVAAELPGGTAETRLRDATALYAMLVGTLQLARAVGDMELSDQILERGISAALASFHRSEESRGPR